MIRIQIYKSNNSNASDNFTDSPFVNVIYIGQQLKAPSIICLHITQDFNYLTAICKEGKIIYIFILLNIIAFTGKKLRSQP